MPGYAPASRNRGPCRPVWSCPAGATPEKEEGEVIEEKGRNGVYRPTDLHTDRAERLCIVIVCR
eukprot:8162813-Pyramimonas_sp.AAC.1